MLVAAAEETEGGEAKREHEHEARVRVVGDGVRLARGSNPHRSALCSSSLCTGPPPRDEQPRANVLMHCSGRNTDTSSSVKPTSRASCLR